VRRGRGNPGRDRGSWGGRERCPNWLNSCTSLASRWQGRFRKVIALSKRAIASQDERNVSQRGGREKGGTRNAEKRRPRAVQNLTLQQSKGQEGVRRTKHESARATHPKKRKKKKKKKTKPLGEKLITSGRTLGCRTKGRRGKRSAPGANGTWGKKGMSLGVHAQEKNGSTSKG